MISNYIFNHLAQDSTDSTASAVLSSVRARMKDNSIAESQIPEYLYLSLKSLLGSTVSGNDANGNPKWAVNTIRSGSANPKFRNITTPDELPLIFLEVRNFREDKRSNTPGRFTAIVDIAVMTNPKTTNSTNAFNIMQRINESFISYSSGGRPGKRDIASGITAIKGFLNLTLERVNNPVNAWDLQTTTYSAEALMIV